jgi:hypothetical protein
MFTRVLITIFLSVNLLAPVYGSSDTLRWNDKIDFDIQPAEGRSPESYLDMGKSFFILPQENIIEARAHASERGSWRSAGASKELAYQYFRLVLASAELWAAEVNDWSWDNAQLPIDYQLAYAESKWDSLASAIERMGAELGYGRDSALTVKKLHIAEEAIRERQSLSSDDIYSSFGLGMDFFGSFAPEPSQQMGGLIGMGVSVDVYYRRLGLTLMGNLLNNELKSAEPPINDKWAKGQSLQHGQFSAAGRYILADMPKIRISPYIGLAYTEVSASGYDRNSGVIQEKPEKLGGFSPIGGIDTDIKLLRKKVGGRQPAAYSYWLIRLGVSYSSIPAGNGTSLDYLSIRLGMGGFTRLIP